LAKALSKLRQNELHRKTELAELHRAPKWTEQEWDHYTTWVLKELAEPAEEVIDHIAIHHPNVKNEYSYKALVEQVNTYGVAYPSTYLAVRKLAGLQTIGHLSKVLKYKNPGEYFNGVKHG
jgi:hypothetical protein